MALALAVAIAMAMAITLAMALALAVDLAIAIAMAMALAPAMDNYYQVITHYRGLVHHQYVQAEGAEQAINKVAQKHSDKSNMTANVVCLCSVCNDFNRLRHGYVVYASYRDNKKWFCIKCKKRTNK